MFKRALLHFYIVSIKIIQLFMKHVSAVGNSLDSADFKSV